MSERDPPGPGFQPPTPAAGTSIPCHDSACWQAWVTYDTPREGLEEQAAAPTTGTDTVTTLPHCATRHARGGLYIRRLLVRRSWASIRGEGGWKRPRTTRALRVLRA